MKKGYSDNWFDIAEKLKKKFKYCCERCGKSHKPKEGYCLTVHHLDRNKTNNADWNLAVLCQRCHLHIQNKVKMSQLFWDFIGVSDWFKPHLRGYIKSKVLGKVKEGGV